MKPFSFNDFNKYHNRFIWSHSDIEQSYWTKEIEYWDSEERTNKRTTGTLSTIRYKGERIIQFYTNDDNNHHRRLSTYQTYKDTATQLKLIEPRSYNTTSNTYMDALYYLANPPKYYNNNGTLKKGFWGILKRRIRSPQYKPSWVTTDMFNEGIKILETLYSGFDASIRSAINKEDYIVSTLEDNIGSRLFYFDPLKKKFYINGNGNRIRLRNETVYIHSETDPRHYGYIYNEQVHAFIRPNDFVHNNSVYDRDEVHIAVCSECERECISEHMLDGVCKDCLDAPFKIHNYSTRVEGMLKFKAKKVKPSTIYLGCELEYETKDRDKAQIDVGKLLKGHALMKSDGSIQNGFEIVTCPATMDIHLEVFKNFYDNIPKDLKIQSNVGMHVHISRKPLSQLTIGKMTEFLNREDNKEFIHHIAGRINNNFARMDKNRSLTFAWKYKNGDDRYNALNLNNQNTIEIRLFSTPMDYITFAMRLQFVQALVDYCSPAQSNESLKKQTHHEAFVDWLSQRKRMFPELSNHLKGYK